MLLLVSLLVLLLTLSFIAVVWFLYKDRESWRTRYLDLLDSRNEREHSLLSDSREREKYLFDEILKAKQIRPVALKDKELPKPQVFVSSEEIAELTDRLNERVEAGVMSDLDATTALSDVRSGRKTQAEVDLNIWQAQSLQLPGSVVEPI